MSPRMTVDWGPDDGTEPTEGDLVESDAGNRWIVEYVRRMTSRIHPRRYGLITTRMDPNQDTRAQPDWYFSRYRP